MLIADDDDEMRAALVDILRDEGCDVIEASNGRHLFWSVESSHHVRPIDLVVSDLRMPTYDGLDVAEAWAEAGSCPRLILISASQDAEDRDRAARLGVTLLSKPFNVEYFMKLVWTLLRAAANDGADP